MLFYSTIDLDTHRGELSIIKNILKCKNFIKIDMENSPSKRGLHIRLFCAKDCLKCRRKYDDAIRYTADMKFRQPHQRNILFGKKIKYYPEKGIKIIQIKKSYEDMCGEKSGVYKMPKVKENLKVK